jgi:hypothetical protein
MNQEMNERRLICVLDDRKGKIGIMAFTALSKKQAKEKR